MRRNKGFTLIELMIVVAIIAILSAIAIPSYSDYVRRSKITDAIATLAGMRVKMEQYYQDNRTYVGACAAGTVATLPPASAYFTFACPNPTTATYTITATGIASMLGFGYSLDQTNARATTAVPTGWITSNTCWVLKKDGSC